MNLFPADILEASTKVLAAARAKGVMIATAESCTGGLIVGALTEVAGSSDVVERGFVTYSNAAKTAMLGVPAALIEAHGAVSLPVARAMAEGAVANSKAAIAVAVTGVAGPGGGSALKPVGLVCFSSVRKGFAPQGEERRFGDAGRTAVRIAAVRHALALLMARIDEA